MHMQSGAYNVHSVGLKEFLDHITRGALRRLITQEVGYGIQPRKNPIHRLYPTLRLHTHTGRFERRGCLRLQQLLGPQLTIFLAANLAFSGQTFGKL